MDENEIGQRMKAAERLRAENEIRRRIGDHIRAAKAVLHSGDRATLVTLLEKAISAAMSLVEPPKG